MLDEVVDVHEKHEVHRVLLLARMKNRLSHESIKVIDISLEVEVSVKTLFDVVHQLVTSPLQ